MLLSRNMLSIVEVKFLDGFPCITNRFLRQYEFRVYLIQSHFRFYLIDMEKQAVVGIQPELQSSADTSNSFPWGLERSNGTVYAAVNTPDGNRVLTLYSEYAIR